MKSESGLRTKKIVSERCPVFKINLTGHFVFIDEKTEQLLGAKCEDLFGKSIQGFVDEKSYEIILSFLNSGNRYETFYESAQLNFIDIKNHNHFSNVVISLNFIAGNPANYQVIVTPDNSPLPISQISHEADWNIEELLFSYITSLDDEINYDDIFDMFLENETIVQIGMYRLKNNKPYLLGSKCRLEYIDKGMKLPQPKGEQISSALKGYPHVLDGTEKYDGLTDISLSLDFKNKCWGILRLFCKGDYIQIRDALKMSADFIGTSLFSYINEKNNLQKSE